MADSIILSQSEYEQLLEEIHQIQARIVELTAMRDDLLYHICPALKAEYEEKIASLERELLAAQMYLQEKRRIIEILQSQMNRQKAPSMDKARKEAHEEFRSYQEDLKRKAKEAEDFKWNEQTLEELLIESKSELLNKIKKKNSFLRYKDMTPVLIKYKLKKEPKILHIYYHKII